MWIYIVYFFSWIFFLFHPSLFIIFVIVFDDLFLRAQYRFLGKKNFVIFLKLIFVQYCSGFSFIQGIKNLRIVIDKWGKNQDLGEEKTKQNKMLWNSRRGEGGKLVGDIVMGIKHLQALPIMEEGVDRLPMTTILEAREVQMRRQNAGFPPHVCVFLKCTIVAIIVD